MDNTIDIKHELVPAHSPEIIVLKFADSAVPVFKESRNKDYIKFGEDNLYPEYLTFLFNKSAKHNAILNGKANYIFGNGYANGDMVVNRNNESLNDLSRKSILDIEIYGGFRWEIIYNYRGLVSEIYHVDFACIRKGKNDGFYYKDCWNAGNRDEEEFIPAFNPMKPKGSQIFEYNEYRPGIRFYPLPSYIGCNNYIETDIEISKYYLSAIRNGMMPSKMIQFYGTEPPEEKKREIERKFANKFSGAENAGKFIMVMTSSKEKAVDIEDLSPTEIDKQFIELNKTTQQEIFSGHNITSPMLFGIKTEGQLGGSTELNIAYSIFQNTYSKPKSKAFDKEINWLLSYSIFKGTYELQPTDPVGLQFDVKDVIDQLPTSFIFEKLGIPKELWNAPHATGTPAITTPEAEVMANDNIKNLTAKQHQQLMRIIRQYSRGQLTELAAKALLRTGLGLNDEDINNLLGIEQKFEAQNEDEIIAMFDACGESKNDFEIIKSKKVSFEANEIEEDEKIYIEEAFKTYDVTVTENKIIELIKKDAKVTAEVIAGVIGETVAYVEAKIKNLVKRGYIESSIEKIGEDEIIKRIIPKDLDIDVPPPRKGTTNPTQIFIKYSYEGPQDSRNRPFCAKMMQLNRLYSRYDIEKISERLGYSVFDRRGGFWTHSDGSVTPYCRHIWKSNIVVKKGGKDVS